MLKNSRQKTKRKNLPGATDLEAHAKAMAARLVPAAENAMKDSKKKSKGGEAGGTQKSKKEQGKKSKVASKREVESGEGSDQRRAGEPTSKGKEPEGTLVAIPVRSLFPTWA